MTWQWWVAQILLSVVLLLVVVSMQQRTAVRLLWWRWIATATCFIALIFLGSIPALIVCTAGIIRNSVALYFAYKPKTPTYIKWIASILIVAMLITLNAIFWEGYLTVLTMIFAIGFLIMFMQRKPSTTRLIGLVVYPIGITFNILILSPMGTALELFALLSTIVAIFRLDIKNKATSSQTD
jgi:E3 ubiquitin-protein ligase DOA10